MTAPNAVAIQISLTLPDDPGINYLTLTVAPSWYEAFRVTEPRVWSFGDARTVTKLIAIELESAPPAMSTLVYTLEAFSASHESRGAIHAQLLSTPELAPPPSPSNPPPALAPAPAPAPAPPMTDATTSSTDSSLPPTTSTTTGPSPSPTTTTTVTPAPAPFVSVTTTPGLNVLHDPNPTPNPSATPTSIGDREFAGAGVVQASIRLPDACLVGYEAFAGYEKLTGMVCVPPTTTFATRGTDSRAFMGATGITQVRFLPNPSAQMPPSAVLGGSICAGCTSLRYVDLGNRFATLGSGEFQGCVALERVVFRRHVTIESTAGENAPPFGDTPFAAIFAPGTGPHPPGLYLHTGMNNVAYFDGTSDYAHVAPNSTAVTYFDTPTEAPADVPGTLVIGSGVISIPDRKWSDAQHLSAITNVDMSLAVRMEAVGALAFEGIESSGYMLVFPPSDIVLGLVNRTFQSAFVGGDLYIPRNVSLTETQVSIFRHHYIRSIFFECKDDNNSQDVRLVNSFNHRDMDAANANTTLVSVDLGDRVSHIDDYAFSNCASLSIFTVRRPFTVGSDPNPFSLTPFSAYFGDSSKQYNAGKYVWNGTNVEHTPV